MRLLVKVVTAGWLVLGAVTLVGCGGAGGGTNLGSQSASSGAGTMANTPATHLAALNAMRDTPTTPVAGSVEGTALKYCPDGACSSPVVSFDTGNATADGLIPAAGEKASLSGTTATATTDASGHFVLQAPSGHYDLTVTNADASLKTRVAIIGRATVSVSPSTVSRLQAAEKVKQALGTSANPEMTCIVCPLQPLPAGTTVEPALGNDNSEPDTSLSYKFPARQWFVYVDSHIATNFHHAVQYYFVDAETGAVTMRRASSWPKINKLNYYGAADAMVASEDVLVTPTFLTDADSGLVSSSVAQRRAALARTAARADAHQPLRRHFTIVDHTLRAMLVQGTRTETVGSKFAGESAFGRDITHMRDFLKAAAVTYDEELWQPPNNKQGFLALYAKLAARTAKEDTFVFYITGHCDVKPSFQLDARKLEDGTEGYFDSLNINDIDLSKIKARNIVFIFEGCHSGKWIAKLKPKLEALPGRHWVILTATDDKGEAVSLASALAIYGISGSVYTRELADQGDNALILNEHPLVYALWWAHSNVAYRMADGGHSAYIRATGLAKSVADAKPQIAFPNPDHVSPNPGTY